MTNFVDIYLYIKLRSAVRVGVRHGVRVYQVLAPFSSRCVHKRIVNIMQVHIESNNIQVELIRFRKQIAILLKLEILKWEYRGGVYEIGFIAFRDESPLICAGGAGRFGT